MMMLAVAIVIGWPVADRGGAQLLEVVIGLAGSREMGAHRARRGPGDAGCVERPLRLACPSEGLLGVVIRRATRLQPGRREGGMVDTNPAW